MRIAAICDDTVFNQILSNTARTLRYIVQIFPEQHYEDVLQLASSYDILILGNSLKDKSVQDYQYLLRNIQTICKGKSITPPAVVVYSKDSGITPEITYRMLYDGIDDVQRRPLNTDEMMHRLIAIYRRMYKFSSNVVVCGKLRYNLATREIEFLGAGKIEKMDFTHNESLVLGCLMMHRNRIVRKEVLMQHLYDPQRHEEVNPRIVDVYLFQIRRILQQYGIADYIETRSRQGVSLVAK